MRCTVFLILLSLVAAAAKAPWFCHDLDCPTYKLVAKNDDYETRKYDSSEWVATKVEGYVYSASITQGFTRLFKYISGENEDHVNINMTAPVATAVQHGDGPFCKSNFTVHFYVPPSKDSTPKPSNEDVFLTDYPATTFFVYGFGGFAVDFDISLRAASLSKKLKAAGEEFEEDWYIIAGYDAPFKLTGRHNEIWIMKKSRDDDDSTGPMQ